VLVQAVLVIAALLWLNICSPDGIRTSHLVVEQPRQENHVLEVVLRCVLDSPAVTDSIQSLLRQKVTMDQYDMI
jgi:hypothetical protein